MDKHNANGFTLLELMIVIAIVGILAALAAPSFQGMRNQQAVDGTARSFVSALNLARTTALSTRQEAYVCLSDNSSTCNGATNGWIVVSAVRNIPEGVTGTIVGGQAVLPSDLVQNTQAIVVGAVGNSSTTIKCKDSAEATQDRFVFYNSSYRRNRHQTDQPPNLPKPPSGVAASVGGAECVINSTPAAENPATVTITLAGLVEVQRR